MIDDKFNDRKEELRLDFEGRFAKIFQDAYDQIQEMRRDYQDKVAEFRKQIETNKDQAHKEFMD